MYGTFFSGRDACYGENIANGQLTLHMGDNINSEEIIQVLNPAFLVDAMHLDEMKLPLLLPTSVVAYLMHTFFFLIQY